MSLVECDVEAVEIDMLPRVQRDRFVTRTGWGPGAESTPYRWYRLRPRRIQAWREANELAGRELMRDDRWLD